MSLDKNFAFIAEQFKTFTFKQKLAFIAFISVLVVITTGAIGHNLYFTVKGEELCEQVCISVGTGEVKSLFITYDDNSLRKGCYCSDDIHNKTRWRDYDFLGYPVSKGAGVYSWFSSLFKSKD